MSFISYLGDLLQPPSQTPVDVGIVVSTSLRTAGPQAGMLQPWELPHHAQTPETLALSGENSLLPDVFFRELCLDLSAKVVTKCNQLKRAPNLRS